MFPKLLSTHQWSYYYDADKRSGSPPPRSSGRSAGGGSRSPAAIAEVSTVALVSPCPEDAACRGRGAMQRLSE